MAEEEEIDSYKIESGSQESGLGIRLSSTHGWWHAMKSPTHARGTGGEGRQVAVAMWVGHLLLAEALASVWSCLAQVLVPRANIFRDQSTRSQELVLL